MINKKTAFKAVFLYLLITSGIWAFLNVNSNSYNRLSEEKIEPANLVVKSGDVYLSILDNTYKIDTSFMNSGNWYYYLAAPDEMRWVWLIQMNDKNLSSQT